MVTRDEWVAATTEHLHEHLSGLGYTVDVCRDLAEGLYEMPPHTVRGAVVPRQAVLTRVLETQDIGPTTAEMIARNGIHLDWSRVFVSSMTTGGLLGVGRVTLQRYRERGVFPPAIVHESEHRIETLAYSLADILFVLAMDRHFRSRGGPGAQRFPWAE